MRSTGRHCERGLLTLGPLLKTVLVLGFLFTVGFDGAHLMSATAAVADVAPDAGRAAVDTVAGQPHTEAVVEEAYNAAEAVAEQHDLKVRRSDFSINPDGWVHLTVVGDAPTILLHHVPGFSGWKHPSKTTVVTP
jgi:hypothetical protein